MVGAFAEVRYANLVHFSDLCRVGMRSKTGMLMPATYGIHVHLM